MKRSVLHLVVALVALGTFVFGGALGRSMVGEARAQSAPRVTTKAMPNEPEVGQTFQIVLTVMSETGVGRVGDAAIRVPAGLRASPPRVGTQTSMRIINGVRSQESGASVTWTVLAEKEGKFTVPAPTVEIDGRTITGQALTVQVQAPGAGGGTGAFPFPSSPFSSPFFSNPRDPFGFDDRIDDDTPNDADELAMAAPLDTDIFLRAVPDKSSVVVGEQVTLSFYVYYRVDFEMTERQEAPLESFLRFPILTDPASTHSQHTRVGGERWDARLIDKIALFPVQAGKLKTGSFGARFKGRRIGARVLRQSNDVTIDVSEPPVDGRPAGYTVGDVGNYQLTATVVPRTGAVGDAITVMVKVEGVGNVPAAIHPPPSDDIEWLDPEKKENIAARGGKVSGYRTFGYVAILKKPGRVALGKLRLPTYDPEAKGYKVAEVDLGSIDVTGTAAKGDDDKGEGVIRTVDFASQLPGPKEKLSAFVPARPFSIGASLYTLAIPPLAAIGLVVAVRARRRYVERAAAAGPRQKNASEALGEARKAEKSGDAKAAARAASDALLAAIADVTGENPRGMPSHEIARALDAAGVDAAVSASATALLARFDEIRFVPTSEGVAAGLAEEAAAVAQRLKQKGA